MNQVRCVVHKFAIQNLSWYAETVCREDDETRNKS